MDILSLRFFLYAMVGIALFYALPQKIRPYWILVLSLLFVVAASPFGIVFIFLTCYMAFRAAQKISEGSGNRKGILILNLSLSLSALLILKYLLSLPFFQSTLEFHEKLFTVDSFIKYYCYPVGLSYYTLQIISYLMDVYWNRIQPEKSFWKVLTYTCYFPQLVQGPISKYSELEPEIFREHSLSWTNLKFGSQLILWGMFKKIVISNRAGELVSGIFYGETPSYGLTVWIGLLLFGAQLYCDFGGGIDIIRGVSQCFDISLKENFRQPFFSHSLGEFWRRWHISLGEWMKDYVFYSVSISKPMKSIKKQLKKFVSKKTANRITIGLANIFVFVLVGIWHGTGTNFFAWGLYNGVILAISAVLAEEYLKWKNAVHVRADSLLWTSFTWLRTLFVVTVGWIFDCADTAKGSFYLLWNAFQLHKTNLGVIMDSAANLALICIFGLIVFSVSVYKEKSGRQLREQLSSLNFWQQAFIWTALIQIILGLGASSGGFMYANF